MPIEKLELADTKREDSLKEIKVESELNSNTKFESKKNALSIKNRSVLDGIVEESLKRPALWEEVKNRLHTSAMALSGGQQQRLSPCF